MRRHPIPNQPFILLAVVALAGVGATVTSASQRQEPLEKLKERRTELRTEIDHIASDRACREDSDCSSLPLGAKPCGGPWEHLVFSKMKVRFAALERKTQEYNSIDKRVSEAEEIISTCETLPPPEPRCIKMVCRDASSQNVGSNESPL